MNYYSFHIGDYASHTAHLSPMEDLAYRRMLDMYYRTQKPLPADTAQIARHIRLTDNIADIELVLYEFFELGPDGWANQRAEKEIESFQKMKEGGAKGAAKRWAKGGDSQGIATPSPPHANPNANHTQSHTHTQSQLIQEPNGSLSSAKLPDCPHGEILKLWAKHLPHLAQPRIWDGSRKQLLRARWAQCASPSSFSEKGYQTVDEGLVFWDSFLAYIAKDTRLADGFEGNGRSWKPDLPWILKAENFAKIIDGKYDV
jgi:uncharacterized protein YdaU (DUF1376 family)